MEKELKELLTQLEEAVTSEDFINISYDIIDEIEQREDCFKALQPILMIIEKNPNIDFGKPGPLVHFVEKFYKNGYEEKLIESLNRFPTKHTVWMLNRIINGSQGESKNYFIKVFDNIINYPDLDNEVLLLVRHFKDLNLKEFN